MKLDEDLAPSVGEPLRRAGYDVATVVGQSWAGVGDRELLDRVGREGRFLVTADTGFGDVRRYPPGSLAGILLLRPYCERVVEFRELIESVIAKYDLADLRGAVIVASIRSVRLRRPTP
ncbi:MAG: DUF5615 family PIN-like protein [Phycisphaerae bacterium]